MGGQGRNKRLFELDKMMQQEFGGTSVRSGYESYWCCDASSFPQERKAIKGLVGKRMQYPRVNANPLVLNENAVTDIPLLEPFDGRFSSIRSPISLTVVDCRRYCFEKYRSQARVGCQAFSAQKQQPQAT